MWAAHIFNIKSECYNFYIWVLFFLWVILFFSSLKIIFIILKKNCKWYFFDNKLLILCMPSFKAIHVVCKSVYLFELPTVFDELDPCIKQILWWGPFLLCLETSYLNRVTNSGFLTVHVALLKCIKIEHTCLIWSKHGLKSNLPCDAG